MDRITKLDIGVNGLFSSLETVLKSWRPPALKTEVAYSKALADVFRAVLPEDARVECEYRHQGTTCDVYVLYKSMLFPDEEIFFEVKRNLRRKGECDRLVGQVESLKPKKHNVWVVLIGDTDPELLGRLKDQFRSYLESAGWGTMFKLSIVK